MADHDFFYNQSNQISPESNRELNHNETMQLKVGINGTAKKGSKWQLYSVLYMESNLNLEFINTMVSYR